MTTNPPPAATQLAAVQLTEYLERLGVERVPGMCGHSLVQLLDALDRSKVRYISCRHEQLAAHIADGYARVSGKTGVVITHVGPGLTNAITGIATASLDCIPMVVITGNVQSYRHGRGPHQEVNLHADSDQIEMCRPICKRVYRVGRAEDLPRIMERAFHLAQSGRPGVVLVDVPWTSSRRSCRSAPSRSCPARWSSPRSTSRRPGASRSNSPRPSAR